MNIYICIYIYIYVYIFVYIHLYIYIYTIATKYCIVPVMAIVGEKEQGAGELTYRVRNLGDVASLPVAEALSILKSTLDQNIELSENNDIHIIPAETRVKKEE